MAALAPGILLKLINGIHSGIKPTGEHRSALLQVTDIVPVDVDQKDLWPTHGFYIKISDSSHSIYATLPYEQDELILSNKIQLGQFIYVDRLEPGSPVPIIKGAKPLPGRHALVGTPEPITRIKSNGEKMGIEKLPSHTRGSWSQDQNAAEPVSSPYVVKPIALDFDKGIPIKEGNGSTQKGMIPASPMVRGRLNKDIGIRSSASGFIPKMADMKYESPNVIRKSCVGLPSASKIPRSKSVCEREQRMPQTPMNSSEKKSTTPPPRLRSARTEVSFSLPEDDPKPTNSSSALRLRSQSHRITSKNDTSQSMPMNDDTSCFATTATLPGKLNMIGKEVIQQRDTTQKVALQALRDASASETLVRVLKMFTELSKNAKPETPAPCLDEFLSFNQEIAQAVRDMESVQAATNVLLETVREPEYGTSILNEIPHNSIDQQGCPSLSRSKRRTAVSKSASIGFDRSDTGSRSTTNCKKAGDRKVHNECESICDPNQASNYSTFTNAIRLGKQIETEAGNWFMEFLEAALETGFKKPRGSATTFLRKASTCCCPQPLILKVINWIEVEQSDASKRPVHPRAAHIARKLRIKAKNP